MLHNPNYPHSEQEMSALSLQQRVLAYAMLHKQGNATILYTPRADGERHLAGILNENEIGALIAAFQKDPKECLAYARQNLIAIFQDKNLAPDTREERAWRYIDAYIDLMIRLDRAAFPATQKIQRGIPDYVPDGLSDMGKEDDPNPALRNREKIRVDKTYVFKHAREMLFDVLRVASRTADSTDIKMYLARRVGHFVHRELPYDKAQRAPDFGKTRSLRIGEVRERHLAVCRHHALYVQVLMQALGLTSRVLKCRLNGGGHAANLVRINGEWHVLDATVPDTKNDVYLAPVHERDIDLNHHDYIFTLGSGTPDPRVYASHSTMYYRVRDNRRE